MQKYESALTLLDSLAHILLIINPRTLLCKLISYIRVLRLIPKVMRLDLAGVHSSRQWVISLHKRSTVACPAALCVKDFKCLRPKYNHLFY